MYHGLGSVGAVLEREANVGRGLRFFIVYELAFRAAENEAWRAIVSLCPKTNKTNVGKKKKRGVQSCCVVVPTARQGVPQTAAGPIQFEGGLCLTSTGATPTNSGTTTAAPCVPGNKSQLWLYTRGMLTSARDDCAGSGSAGCCLSVSSGASAPGTIVQLYGCDPGMASAFGFHLTHPHPGLGTARLVNNASGLCVTSGVSSGGRRSSTTNEQVIREPVVHEFIRHGPSVRILLLSLCYYYHCIIIIRHGPS